MTALVPATAWAQPPVDTRERTAAKTQRRHTEGDSTDFGEFVRAVLPELLRYGHALTGNPHDAADLVQGVLERLGARWTTVLHRAGDPVAYARRAMVNAQISGWRRRRRERLVAEPPDTAVVFQPDRFTDEPLWQALRALPPRQRAVIVLRYYECLSEAEIADTLGVTKGTVKSQANKAMTTLRTRMGATSDGRERR